MGRDHQETHLPLFHTTNELGSGKFLEAGQIFGRITSEKGQAGDREPGLL